MLRRIIARLRRDVVAYIAIAIAVAGSGGYAIAAASHPKAITVCANKKTKTVYNDASRKGRCTRQQAKLSWNQIGPRGFAGARGATGATGPQGPQGATGATGTTASAWGVIADNGNLGYGAQGLSATRLAAGTYQITITTPACSQGANVPTVTVSDANPPAGQGAGAFPAAWVGDTGDNRQFTVTTGVVVNGVFTATDHTFNVQDVC